MLRLPIGVIRICKVDTQYNNMLFSGTHTGKKSLTLLVLFTTSLLSSWITENYFDLCRLIVIYQRAVCYVDTVQIFFLNTNLSSFNWCLVSLFVSLFIPYFYYLCTSNYLVLENDYHMFSTLVRKLNRCWFVFVRFTTPCPCTTNLIAKSFQSFMAFIGYSSGHLFCKWCSTKQHYVQQWAYNTTLYDTSSFLL